MSETIVVLDPIGEARAEALRALLPRGFVLEYAAGLGDAHAAAAIENADYAISGQVPVPAAVLRAAKRLKLLHKWGVGVDNIDVDAARALGIKVARTTGSNAQAVAEYTIGLMIGALRHVAYGHEGMQRGEWRNWDMPTPYLLSGKTVGLVGFGAIGRAVARLLSGFRCQVLYFKPNPLPADQEARHGVRHAPLARLLARSDVVSLHCPLNARTAGLIDRAALKSMKQTAVLVNVARGGVVVEDDLVWALNNGEIHAAACDVYETEPLPADSPLRGIPRLTLTPHRAAMAADTFEPTVRRMFENIARVSRGEPVAAGDAVVE